MLVSYGTAGQNQIVLQFVRCNVLSSVAMRDQRETLMYIKSRLHFEMLYQRAAMSYSLQNQPPNQATVQPLTVVAGAGQQPTLTAAAIRRRLMIERQQLTVTDTAGNVLLQSPRPGKLIDAALGPIPVDCTVKSTASENMFRVDWIIETAHSDAEKFVSTPPLLMSHEWREETGFTDQFFEVRRRTGRCIFNPGELPALILPDDYRRWFFAPCFNGWQRHVDYVVADESGIELRYQYTDTEQRISTRLFGITKIECIDNGVVSTVAWVSTGTAAAANTMTWANQVARQVGLGLIPGAGALGATAGIAQPGAQALSNQAQLQFAGQAAQAANLAPNPFVIGSWLGGRLIPQQTRTCSVRVYGNSHTPMLNLQVVAWLIVAYRLGNWPLGNSARAQYNTHVSESQYPMIGMVELNASLVRSIEAGVGQTALNLVFPGQSGANVGIVPPIDDLGPGSHNFFDTGGGFGPPLLGSQIPPFDGTRGFNLAVLMSQFLQGDAQAPATPAQPRSFLFVPNPQI